MLGPKLILKPTPKDPSTPTLRFYLDQPNQHIERMINDRGHEVVKYEVKGYDIQLFTPGPDPSPFWYGEYRLQGVTFDLERDRIRRDIYLNKPALFPRVGICQGALFLSAMAGDRIWQKVNNHRLAHHLIKVKNGGKIFKVSSTHSQMVNLHPNSEAYVLASANTCTERENEYKQVNTSTNDWNDPEMWYYWNTTSLCCQYLPWIGSQEGLDYFWFELEDCFCPRTKKETT